VRGVDAEGCLLVAIPHHAQCPSIGMSAQ